MGRLICISNRIPTGANPSGGLVVALADVLTETGGIWIGSSGNIAHRPEETLIDLPDGPFRRMSFDLSPAEQEGYYAGFSNSVLWPLFHSRTDLLDIQREHLDVYKTVNRRIARMVRAVLQADDLIWVHDFHLLPLAYELRNLGVSNRIGFFLHTPFPPALALQALPNAAEICSWLTRFDLIGLQSERDVQNCLSGLSIVGGATQTSGGVTRDERSVAIAAFPIGIDAAEFTAVAEDEFRKLPEGIVKPHRRVMIGVDRLDYTKGLPQRFRAFGTFLERHEDWHRHVSLLQISPPTREGVKAYDDIREELEHLAGRINGAHADITWQPIRYIHRPIPRTTLAGLYRAAHVGLVTPLMDGMNLVAKEFVAAQNPDDPGVLVLSQFAGAAERMPDALLINPHDIEQTSAAMLTALSMMPAERRRRHQALMKTLETQDVHWWSKAFLSALAPKTASALRLA